MRSSWGFGSDLKLLDTGCPVTCKNKRTRMSPTSSNKKEWRAICVYVLSFIFASIMSAEHNPTIVKFGSQAHNHCSNIEQLDSNDYQGWKFSADGTEHFLFILIELKPCKRFFPLLPKIPSCFRFS